MTEAEWLAYDDADSLRLCLIRRFDDISDRKMHLFACACCRRIWHLLRDDRSRHAVEVTERFADGLATRKELAAARAAALIVAREPLRHATQEGFHRAARAAAQCAQRSGRDAGHWASDYAARAMGDMAYFGSGGAAVHPPEVWPRAIRTESREQAPLFRDIFGNPFRPVAIDPAWLSWHDGTVPRSPRPSMRTVPSTACRSWPTPWKRPVVRRPTSWLTAASQASMCAGVGC
jgi:hypothetical protein